MKKLSVRITYEGGPDPVLDDSIKKAMKKAGCKWYAQGYNLCDGIRDMAFDLVIDLKNSV